MFYNLVQPGPIFRPRHLFADSGLQVIDFGLWDFFLISFAKIIYTLDIIFNTTEKTEHAKGMFLLPAMKIGMYFHIYAETYSYDE